MTLRTPPDPWAERGSSFGDNGSRYEPSRGHAAPTAPPPPPPRERMEVGGCVGGRGTLPADGGSAGVRWHGAPRFAEQAAAAAAQTPTQPPQGQDFACCGPRGRRSWVPPGGSDPSLHCTGRAVRQEPGM